MRLGSFPWVCAALLFCGGSALAETVHYQTANVKFSLSRGEIDAQQRSSSITPRVNPYECPAVFLTMAQAVDFTDLRPNGCQAAVLLSCPRDFVPTVGDQVTATYGCTASSLTANAPTSNTKSVAVTLTSIEGAVGKLDPVVFAQYFVGVFVATLSFYFSMFGIGFVLRPLTDRHLGH